MSSVDDLTREPSDNGLEETRDRVRRLRRAVLVLLVVVVFGAFVAPLAVIWSFQSASNDAQLAVTCTTLKSSIAELQAIRRNGIILEDIARSFGLPVAFPPPLPIPEVPAECRE